MFLCLLQANLNSENIRLMSAMLCAALYPNVVQVCIHSVYHWNDTSEASDVLSLLSFTLIPCFMLLCSRYELLRAVIR